MVCRFSLFVTVTFFSFVSTECVTKILLSSSLGRAENSCYQCYLVPLKIYYRMISHRIAIFYYINQKPLIRAFQWWYIGWLLGPKIDLKAAYLPSWPCHCYQHQFFFCVPQKNSQRHQPTPPGAETIPLICSRFELSVLMVLALGVVDSWRCVMTTWHHVWSAPRRLDWWGLFSPPPSTFLHCLGKKALSACSILI
jgi:hypothetical protein